MNRFRLPTFECGDGQRGKPAMNALCRLDAEVGQAVDMVLHQVALDDRTDVSQRAGIMICLAQLTKCQVGLLFQPDVTQIFQRPGMQHSCLRHR